MLGRQPETLSVPIESFLAHFGEADRQHLEGAFRPGEGTSVSRNCKIYRDDGTARIVHIHGDIERHSDG